MFSFLKDNNQKNSIPVLDGVRAIACLLVILFHLDLITIDAHVWKPYPVTNFFISALALEGGSGVTLFFVLSGFLLFMPYARALLFEEQWPSMGRFFLRRVLRIWPGYYASLFLIIWFYHPQYFQPDHLKDLGLFLTFFMDSSASTFQKLNGPFWTLAVEWQYYMLLPFLALGFGWIIKRADHGSLRQRWWTLIGCLAAIMVWGVFSRYWGLYFFTHPTETVLVPRPVLNVPLFFLYGADGKFLEDFAAGMLISCAYVLMQRSTAENELHAMTKKFQRASLWMLGTGLLVLFIMTLWNGYQHFQLHLSPLLDAAMPIYNWMSEFGLSVGYALCMGALLFGPAMLRRPLEWPLLRWLGMISYGMYMWHLPLLIEFTFRTHGLPGWNRGLVYFLFWLFVALAIVPFCYIFYRVIEHPGIKLGEIILKRSRNANMQRELLRKNLDGNLDKIRQADV